MKALPALAALAVPFLLAAATPDRAPRVPITSFEQLPKPLPLPYDESADADRAVAAAKLRAKRAGTRLIIDLGGNWCLDCRLLAGTLELPALKGWLDSRYEIVTVDIGRFDKNLDVPAHYGITQRLAGVPALLVVDPHTDKLLDAGRVSALEDARSMNPQALADWLAQWVRR